MKSLKLTLAAAGAVALAASALTGPVHAIDEKEFKVVGTWGNLTQWKEHESRFWNEMLPKASEGKLTANAKPYTELGMSGFEVLRVLKLGAFDAVHALTSYTSQDAPPMEGIDLAGVISDFDTYRKAINAYRPIIERELADKYNAKLLMMYAFPSQQFWCNIKGAGDVSLASLKGKKIRSYSTTQNDLIQGLGASSVTIAFAEVVPALEKGVADCGITGTMPAYSAKWWQVVTHNIRVRIGYGATFMAMNMKSWNALSDDTKALIQKQATELEDQMWKATKLEDQAGMDCNAAGPCKAGKPGGMKPVEPNDADKALLKQAVADHVLKGFAKRCGQKCVDEWNATVGKIAGIQIPN
jgi:TRAP-type C4-dicarboxylate transport system substrate-binding protein